MNQNENAIHSNRKGIAWYSQNRKVIYHYFVSVTIENIHRP